MEQVHMSEAKAIISAVVDMPEPAPNALCTMARLRHRQHDTKAALRLFRDAHELAPEDLYVLTSYATFLFD